MTLTDPAPWTFFGVPRRREPAAPRAGRLPRVPYDGGTPPPGIPTGQRAGPAAVRAACFYDVEADRDYLAGVTMADLGDVAIQGSDTEANYARITRGIAERGSLMVTVAAITRSATRSASGWSPWASSTWCTSTRTPISSTSWTGRG